MTPTEFPIPNIMRKTVAFYLVMPMFSWRWLFKNVLQNPNGRAPGSACMTVSATDVVQSVSRVVLHKTFPIASLTFIKCGWDKVDLQSSFISLMLLVSSIFSCCDGWSSTFYHGLHLIAVQSCGLFVILVIPNVLRRLGLVLSTTRESYLFVLKRHILFTFLKAQWNCAAPPLFFVNLRPRRFLVSPFWVLDIEEEHGTYQAWDRNYQEGKPPPVTISKESVVGLSYACN